MTAEGVKTRKLLQFTVSISGLLITFRFPGIPVGGAARTGPGGVGVLTSGALMENIK